MDYNRYYQARETIELILEKDLVGPLEEDEVIEEYPVVYYVTGKLYPQECRLEVNHDSSEDIGDTEEEQELRLEDGFVPASMGMSFSLTPEASAFSIKATGALYVPQENEGKKHIWKRHKIESDEKIIDVYLLKKENRIEITIIDGLKLVINLHKTYEDGSITVTASLINTFLQSTRESRFWVNQHTIFQPEIKIHGKKEYFTDISKRIKVNKNQEVLEMDMLYSKYVNYVVGHGCAADFIEKKNELELKTSFIPVYNLRQMVPSKSTDTKVLSMKYLSTASQAEIIESLLVWLTDYHKWIKKLEKENLVITEEYKQSATDNIAKCKTTYDTIKKSIDSLSDKMVFKAFRYANEAMLLQRIQTLKNKGIEVDESEIRWYPFQLAFFLKEIISFADTGSIEREIVDLLWFPTGGGKTEAYLGIAAFVIFLRRLRDEENGAGVSVIMRYTLRLLTFQQFERASALICACEVLRRKYGIPGGTVRIGLWAGRALTPNTIEMAENILEGGTDPESESSNPKQLERCPWCGSELSHENYSCSKALKRMFIKCSNETCDFKNGLPVYLIDEEIYAHRPSFLIATVDKFAQVALNENTFSLFGKNSHCKPPELIIQDELHLISGPLGSITGIYEAAFKKMCSHKGINAKIIASTATIKNAGEQILSLYGEDYSQFPPQGIDVDDSYFAVKSSEDEKPSRMYSGCMGTGMSATSVMIRVMAATLYATRYLEALDYDEDIIDSFWTITNYFNTLRELGGAIVRVVDNVQDRFAYLKESKFKNHFPIHSGQLRYDTYIELTSREKSGNIGSIIQKDLQIKYRKEKSKMPCDFILSSNMISVGVDISRLNTMLVVGQPKTTAEYIQATSRVGRETPGFVFTLYNFMRSRDKSHFEQFYQYHKAFYKHVEATSVTPFAERARDRALHTLYVMLCRYYIETLTDNKSAGKYNRDIPGIEDIRKFIKDYVKKVDPDEYNNVAEELAEIELQWELLAKEYPDLTYRKDQFQKTESLFKADYEEESRFRVMNSMRSVETAVQIIMRE